MPLFIGIFLEIFGLAILAFNPDLQGSLYLSIPAVLLPMIIYYIGKKTGKFKGIKVLEEGELTFDELFPDKRNLQSK